MWQSPEGSKPLGALPKRVCRKVGAAVTRGIRASGHPSQAAMGGVHVTPPLQSSLFLKTSQSPQWPPATAGVRIQGGHACRGWTNVSDPRNIALNSHCLPGIS